MIYPAWLRQRSSVARPRVSIVRAIDQRNIDAYLRWRSRWERSFVGIDPLSSLDRDLYGHWYTIRRCCARRWMRERQNMIAHPKQPA